MSPPEERQIAEPHADRTPNRLARETSPYLLQHAYNPVDWYPWGEEAFEAARAQKKPIFLSVGYSTCYWCHVMERESFEDEATAAILNANFIPIKVDREERPDVDEIYMTATQLMTGHGGWPMSVFLEPESLKPFIAGTYFPPEPRHGMSSFTQVLDGVAQAWSQQHDQVMAQAHTVADAVKDRLANRPEPQFLSETNIEAAVKQLMQSYDRQHGGFGGAPKFPQPVFLDFLLGAAGDDEAAVAAVFYTLNRMATGGMYDQLGGGFHRYSTDGQWIVPHFEKMLYDNGQLLSVYAEAFKRTQNPLFEKVVRETAAYVLREMRNRERGGFFSAQDAEVDAREGLSYLWTPLEMEQALTDAGLADDVEFALQVFGVSRGTNFTDPHFPGDGPKNVLVLTEDDITQLGARFKRVQQAMLEFRGQRKQPHLDDKILAGWNGLMIAGLADAGRVFEEQEWTDTAARAASFVLEQMTAADGSLRRVSRHGEARVEAFLEDYALMARACLALHEATGDESWLQRAETLVAEANRRFFDEAHGGYFDTLADQPDLFVRSKSFYDGAVPSGNGVMANNLITLHQRTSAASYLDRAGEVLRAASAQLVIGPSTCALSALALDRLLASDAALAREHEGSVITGAANQHISNVSATVTDIDADGEGVRFTIIITIADGYHINAHEPGDDRLIGLAIQPVEENGEPVKLVADFPAGAPLDQRSALGKSIMVHTGRIEVPVRASRAARVAFDLRYQACSDVACLPPASIRLSVELGE